MKKEKKDIILFFISKVITGILSLLMVTLYSSCLKPEEYGDYSLVSGLITALVSIFIGWIGSSALRYYSSYEKEPRTFFSNVFIYTVFMILIICLILFIVSFFNTTIPLAKYIFPAIVFTISFSFMEVIEKIFRASQKTKIYTICVILESIIHMLLFYIFAKYFNLKANSIFYSITLSRIVYVVIAIFCLNLLRNIRIKLIDKNILKNFLKYGIPMIGVWGVSWLLSYCDRYIIALSYDSYSVGIYDMSYKIGESSIGMVISAFTLAIFPILIRTWNQEGKKGVELKVKETLTTYFILVLPAIVGLSLIAKNLFLGIIDAKYIDGINTIIIIAIGMFFNGVNNVLNKIWQINEKTKNIFWVLLGTVLLNLILNFIFIPLYGMNMAAITTLISYIVSVIITYIFVSKDFKIMFDITSIIKTVISTSVMAFFLILFNNIVKNIWLLFLEVIIAMIIYIIMSIMIGNVSISDFKRKEKDGE